MSSYPVDLSSEHSDSQNYARNTLANQRLVDKSQTVTSAEVSILEGIEAASEQSRPLLQARPRRRRRAGVLLATKDTFLPNAVPLERMKEKRLIAFKKVKVVKKGVASPGPSAGVTYVQHSSPIAAEPVSSLQPDLPTRPSSSSPAEKRPAEKRPSEGMISQGKDKRPRTSPEPVGNAGFELVRRADSLDFENQRLLAQVPSEKEVSLEEELARVKEDLAKSQQINSLIITEKRKLNEDYLGLHKKYEDVSAECKKLKDESSGFDCQITQLCGITDAALAEASCAREEVKELREEVQALKDAATRHPKEIWAAVENYKQSAELQNTLLAAVEEFKESQEFEAALSAAVERFKTSPEFLDALGANSAYRASSFVKKYKGKYPDLRSDYAKFQEDYKGSWFADLDLDVSSSDDEVEEDAPQAGDAPSSS
ncbi:hypothetical protein LIER_02524 [Lithospermum erythrorhizon]|uniref:Uncharacterized protein n=1 Tax=Lithospermum erythrorhizon TaxID=34254 RepID=A0AAV3NPS8_LITER